MARRYATIFHSVVYGTAYLLVYLILLGLLLITPGDAIERSLHNEQRYNVIILTACYVATVVVVVFTYATRLYINKSALASIPKQWVPIDKGDVKDVVYNLIVAGLDRSALIAYEAKPRPDRGEEEPIRRQLKLGPEEREVELPPKKKPWGEIEHGGWASPNSPDLPNLQYNTVISELPNLVEAKVLTLAPPDPTSQSDPPTLDPDAVLLLQRQPSQTLREYVNHLAKLRVLVLDDTIAAFLRLYEEARFSNRPISREKFRELMHLFAETLRALQSPDLHALGDALDDESDIDNNAPFATNPSTPQRTPSGGSTAPSASSARRLHLVSSGSASNTAERRGTVPSSGTAQLSRRASSNNSFAQTRQPYTNGSQPSSASLRSAGSGSVIRLATGDDDGDSMYVLDLDQQKRQYGAS